MFHFLPSALAEPMVISIVACTYSSGQNTKQDFSKLTHIKSFKGVDVHVLTSADPTILGRNEDAPV